MALNKKKMIWYIILGVFIIAFYVIVINYNNNENKKIFNNPEYTIGEVTYFSKAKGAVTVPAKPAEIKFKYEVHGDSIENGYVAGVFKVPFSGLFSGEKYLVVYLKSNPQKSRMLFDYPIKSDNDFIRYTKEFKTNPPKLDK